MPRRSILSTIDRGTLLTLPDDKETLIQYYTLDTHDLSVIYQHCGSANRLGFAVQLCYLRFPGIILGVSERPSNPLLQIVASQLNISEENWNVYGKREQTRREHLVELQVIFGFKPFTMSHYRESLDSLSELALQTDKGIILASSLIEILRRKSIILPVINVIDRICSEAVSCANRRIYASLTDSLLPSHLLRLDELLKCKTDSKMTWLSWLRESPSKPNSRHMLEHIKRLKVWHSIDLPTGIDRKIHQNRLLKIAREGGQMTSADLARFEVRRRYATLVALAIEGTATITDEIIDLNDRIIGKLFNLAKNRHQEQFRASGKSINEKLRMYAQIGQALMEAKQNGGDPFAAIEAVIPWERFIASVTEAQQLSQPADFDFLHRIGQNYATIRRYAPEFLSVLKLRATPAAKGVLDAIDLLRTMNNNNTRKMPVDAPIAFVKPRWSKLVFTSNGIDRRYYELCALSELKNALHSGDIWVEGSRQFKDFDAYLVPMDQFISLKLARELLLAVVTECEKYLNDRLLLLEQQLTKSNILAKSNNLPDAIITGSGLKITPIDSTVPDNAQALIEQVSALLPHVKITELLMEVDDWTGFTKHFTHLKNGDVAKDKNLLLTAILSDGINLGLTKMAESCPSTTYAKLSWLQAWYIRDETYSAALAELVNAQFNNKFAANWGG